MRLNGDLLELKFFRHLLAFGLFLNGDEIDRKTLVGNHSILMRLSFLFWHVESLAKGRLFEVHCLCSRHYIYDLVVDWDKRRVCFIDSIERDGESRGEDDRWEWKEVKVKPS